MAVKDLIKRNAQHFCSQLGDLVVNDDNLTRFFSSTLFPTLTYSQKNV